MTALAQRKEDDRAEPSPNAPYVTVNKASKMLNETRERVTKRCLLGEIRTASVAHVILLLQEDVERIVAEKAAPAATA